MRKRRGEYAGAGAGNREDLTRRMLQTAGGDARELSGEHGVQDDPAVVGGAPPAVGTRWRPAQRLIRSATGCQQARTGETTP